MALEERELKQHVPDDYVKIFYVYSHEEDDTELKRKLDRHLRPRGGSNAAHWDDRDITPGQEWDAEIEVHLNGADIILLLISSDFMASDACYKKMETALARHNKEEALVIPIILRKVDLRKAPFNKLLMLPKNKKPINQWPDKDEACFHVKKEIDRTIDTIIKKREARLKIEKANEFFLQHNYEEALLIYKEALSSLQETSFNKNKVAVLQHIAIVLRRLNRSEEALQTYEKALRLAPDTVQLYSDKGDVLLGKERFTDALDAYEKAIQKSPAEPLLHKKKGDTLLHLGRWVEAIGAYSSAINLIVEIKERTIAAQIYANQGEAFLEIGKFEKALLVFDEAIQIDPGNAELWRRRGEIYAELGQIGKARESYKAAIVRKPDDADLHSEYGDILYRFGYYAGARREYSTAIALEPNFAYAYKGRSNANEAIAEKLDEKSKQLRQRVQEDENRFKQLTD